jgi:hypothetical protein
VNQCTCTSLFSAFSIMSVPLLFTSTVRDNPSYPSFEQRTTGSCMRLVASGACQSTCRSGLPGTPTRSTRTSCKYFHRGGILKYVEKAKSPERMERNDHFPSWCDTSLTRNQPTGLRCSTILPLYELSKSIRECLNICPSNRSPRIDLWYKCINHTSTIMQTEARRTRTKII